MVMRFPLAALLVAVLAAGCGSGSSSGGGHASSLVAKVSHADAKVDGPSIVGTVKISEGGKPGERLALRYGLVDAVSGTRASESERLIAHYTTTGTVAKKDVTIKFAKPSTSTDYLVHFVLYGPDGSYLASSDSPVFHVG